MKIENCGYTIIKRIDVSDAHFVLGYNPKNTYTPYVTWEMFGVEGNWSFNHGHYGTSLKDMELDLLKRSIRYMLLWDFPEIDVTETSIQQFFF